MLAALKACPENIRCVQCYQLQLTSMLCKDCWEISQGPYFCQVPPLNPSPDFLSSGLQDFGQLSLRGGCHCSLYPPVSVRLTGSRQRDSLFPLPHPHFYHTYPPVAAIHQSNLFVYQQENVTAILKILNIIQVKMHLEERSQTVHNVDVGNPSSFYFPAIIAYGDFM